jgi:hypothetical protein
VAPLPRHGSEPRLGRSDREPAGRNGYASFVANARSRRGSRSRSTLPAQIRILGCGRSPGRSCRRHVCLACWPGRPTRIRCRCDTPSQGASWQAGAQRGSRLAGRKLGWANRNRLQNWRRVVAGWRVRLLCRSAHEAPVQQGAFHLISANNITWELSARGLRRGA